MKKIFASIVFLLISSAIGIFFLFVFFDYEDLKEFYYKKVYPLNYEEHIKKYSGEFGLEPSLVAAVIYEESRFDPYSLSDKGAVGLMQILPETASYIFLKIGEESGGFDEENLKNEEINIKYGSFYLSYLFDKYDNWDYTLSAYNAGEGNVDKWLEEGEFEIEFEETNNFVERVKKSQNKYKMLYFEK